MFAAGAILAMSQTVPDLIAGVGLLLMAALLTMIATRINPIRMLNRGQLVESGQERVRAIYEMANTLGTTLDYQKVMQAALDIGLLGLKDLSPDSRENMTGMVLLFRNNVLHIVSARGLTRQDDKITIAGREGIVGKALKIVEPVISSDAHTDPELSYITALASARSVLVVPLRSGYSNYGVLIFGTPEPRAFDSEHIELLTAIGSQAIIALQNAVLYSNLTEEKERILEVEEVARKKLARDLHDGPTQSISTIVSRIDLLKRNLTERKVDANSTADELAKISDIARRTTKEIRNMLFTLRPLVLETQGLIPAVQQLVAKMKDTHNLDVVLQTQSGVEQYIEHGAQGVLFYIVEEAVNNARKHARAKHIYVRLSTNEQTVTCEIEDDGVGFDVASVMEGYHKRSSLGMINMQERVEMIGGALTITSAPNQGTRISIRLPATVTTAASGRSKTGNGNTLYNKVGGPPLPKLPAREIPRRRGPLPKLEHTDG
jgi:signal transduction histidine kinase